MLETTYIENIQFCYMVRNCVQILEEYNETLEPSTARSLSLHKN